MGIIRDPNSSPTEPDYYDTKPPPPVEYDTDGWGPDTVDDPWDIDTDDLWELKPYRETPLDLPDVPGDIDVDQFSIEIFPESFGWGAIERWNKPTLWDRFKKWFWNGATWDGGPGKVSTNNAAARGGGLQTSRPSPTTGVPSGGGSRKKARKKAGKKPGLRGVGIGKYNGRSAGKKGGK